MVPSFWHRNKHMVERHTNLHKKPSGAAKTCDQAVGPHLLTGDFVSRNNFQNSLCSVQSSTSPSNQGQSTQHDSAGTTPLWFPSLELMTFNIFLTLDFTLKIQVFTNRSQNAHQISVTDDILDILQTKAPLKSIENVNNLLPGLQNNF